MPDPISSSNSSPSSSAAHDPTLDEAGQACRSDSPNSSAPEPNASTLPAVTQLVSSVAPRPTLLPPKSAPPAPSTAINNAQRTTERVGIAPYASADRAGQSYAVYAGVALLKGHDPKSGLDVEVLSYSEQVGLERESQLGLVRLGRSTSAGAASVEALTIRANHGIYNDDGSIGYNVGGLATALSAEVTVGGANSVTLGVAAGAGAAGSIGVRDLDHDGNHEICAKLALGALTLGACVETPL